MSILLRILGLSLRHKRRLAGAWLFVAGATASYLVLPWLFGSAIDKIALAFQGGDVSESAIFTIAALILGVSVLRGLFSFGQTYLGEALGNVVAYDLRNDFYDHVQHLSFEFHDRHHTGNLISRAITDVEAIRMFISMGLVRTPYFLSLFLLVSAILLMLDWRLGLLGISLMPLTVPLTGFVRFRLRRIWLSIQEEMAEMSTVLQENLTGVRVVKAFASEEFEMAKFDSKSVGIRGNMIRAVRLWAMNVALIIFVFLIVMGLTLWYGGWLVINEHMTLGELAQFLFYLQVLSVPIRFSGLVVNNFARAHAAGERLFEIMDMESPVRESPNAVEMGRVRGHVRFEDVSFSYNSGPPVLNGINIDAEPGQVIALLGMPGSGKSTVVHLLPRFYDVTSGRVLIDGRDVRDVTLKSLRGNIGIVQQDSFLFTATIRENIAYGRYDATMDEIVEAARIAQLDGYVQSLEYGYETVIGERGATLSGGQRQRLSIARAVLLDPPVLVLDDSTSSVDAGTEESIRKAMESVKRGRTTFVIAHRLSTLHRADQILVLEGGEIVERGTHQELLARAGRYREIYDLQLRPKEEVMLEFDVTVPVRKKGAR